MLSIEKFEADRSGARWVSVYDARFYVKGYFLEQENRDDLWHAEDFKHIKKQLYPLVMSFIKAHNNDEHFINEFMSCFDIDPENDCTTPSHNWDELSIVEKFNCVYWEGIVECLVDDNPDAFIFE